MVCPSTFPASLTQTPPGEHEKDRMTLGPQGDEPPRLLAVLQPAVDLFLDGLGEAADFTFGSCVHNFYGLI